MSYQLATAARFSAFITLSLAGACAASPDTAVDSASQPLEREALEHEALEHEALAAALDEGVARFSALDPSDLPGRREAGVALLERLSETLGDDALLDLPALDALPELRATVEARGRSFEKVALDDGALHDEAEESDLDAPPWVSHGTTWASDDLSWCIGRNTSDIGSGDQISSISDALDQWALRTPLTFSYLTTCSGNDLNFGFRTGDHGDGASNAFDGGGGVLAHAFYPGGSREGAVHFDDAETWTSAEDYTSGQPYDVQTVALHEVGHSLGLEHSADTGSVMYAYYGGSLRSLTTDDISGIQSLYPPDDCDLMYEQMAWSQVYTAFAKMAAALATGTYASSADSAWATALSDVGTTFDAASDGAIEGLGSTDATGAWWYGSTSLSSIMTGYNYSNWSYGATGNSWSKLARDYGASAYDAMAVGRAYALTCAAG